MPITRKKSQKKRLKRRPPETIIIIKETIKAEDTLFPEKVAYAKEFLRNNPIPDDFR